MLTLWKKKKSIDIKDLIKRAADGDKESQFQLGLSYYRGTDIKRNIEKANYWLEKADLNTQESV